MSYNKILTIQDISCVGQCSLTVALPILSACGQETVILPSAVLSTHTGGFKEFTFRDLTDDIPKIQEHWQKEGIKFDAIYTGYLGSLKQINYVEDILDTMGKDSCVKIVDPAMADNGKLYSIFDMEYALRMAELCKKAEADSLSGSASAQSTLKLHEKNIIACLRLSLGAAALAASYIGVDSARAVFVQKNFCFFAEK